MKKNIALEDLAPPQQALLGGVYSWGYDDIFAAARGGDKLAAHVTELVLACHADRLHLERSATAFRRVAQALTGMGLKAANRGGQDIRDCADAMNLNVMADRLVYKEFYAKLETALHKRDEVREGVTFTFNGYSTRMDKGQKMKKAIVDILNLHVQGMAETLHGYKAALDSLAEQHDKLRALCDPRPQAAKEPSSPKALKL